MTMTDRNNAKHDAMILETLENLVPQDHEVRKLEEAVDWSFIYPLVRNLYSSHGRRSIDPVVLFKMVFINYTFGIHSMRRTCKEIEVNLAYRWFLGIAMDESVPNYSTWSQNYIRRYGDSEVFDQIFDHILQQAMDAGFIKVDTIFGDSTHTKANANKRKHTEKEVEITRKEFEEELLDEINRTRAEHDKKPFDGITREEYDFDEKTGEATVRKKTKKIKESTTDPESGNFHKGDHEECFAYSHQTFCDRNGFVLGSVTNPGNEHDSVTFHESYQKVLERFGESIKNVCLDAGYKVPSVAKEIIESGKTPYLPYKRPMTKEGFFRKYEFVYDRENDQYVCPNGETLKYATTDRSGYSHYRSDGKKCAGCPYLSKCTASRNHVKTITRHVWSEHLEKAEEIRHTDSWKEIYPKRKETIERVFADDKENHCLRFTRLRGLKKNRHQASIIFACHNLQRMGKWKWKNMAA